MPTATDRLLILVRHAKAVEDDAGGDHVRPLAPRGVDAAAELGAWLGENRYWPEQVLCSTATRTRQTLAAFGRTLPTILSDKLYLASAADLLHAIHGSDDAVRSLMLIGHNPGLHNLLATLVGDYAQEADADRLILKFPTAACAILKVNVEHWREIVPQSARLAALRY